MGLVKILVDKIGRVVSTDYGPSFDEIDVRLDPGCSVRPGQLLFADISEGLQSRYAVLRVFSAQEINPYENPLASQVRDAFNMESSRGREDLLRKYTVARTQPLEILNKTEEGKFTSEDPSIIVMAGTEIYQDVPELTNEALGFLDPGTPTSIYLGTAIGNEDLKICLDANKTLPRHLLIAGSTGTGKSYLIGLFSEELHRLGVRHVNIDVHGELCDATMQLGGINLLPGKDFTVRLSSLQEPEVLGMLPLTNPLHIDIVTKAFINLKNSGRPFGVSDFVRESLSVTQEFGSGKSTFSIINARVQSLDGYRIIGTGYDWSSILSKEGALINIDCRGLTQTELRTVVGAVARELVSLRKQDKIRPFVFSMDEAHLFLPSHEKVTSSQVLAEEIRMGRHHGVSIMVSSQSPGDIDKRISKITNTRFIFAIEPSELSAISGLLGDTPKELIESLPRLRVGTCLLAGSRESVKHALVIQVRRRSTKDGGSTPLFIKT